ATLGRVAPGVDEVAVSNDAAAPSGEAREGLEFLGRKADLFGRAFLPLGSGVHGLSRVGTANASRRGRQAGAERQDQKSGRSGVSHDQLQYVCWTEACYREAWLDGCRLRGRCQGRKEDCLGRQGESLQGRGAAAPREDPCGRIRVTGRRSW